MGTELHHAIECVPRSIRHASAHAAHASAISRAGNGPTLPRAVERAPGVIASFAASSASTSLGLERELRRHAHAASVGGAAGRCRREQPRTCHRTARAVAVSRAAEADGLSRLRLVAMPVRGRAYLVLDAGARWRSACRRSAERAWSTRQCARELWLRERKEELVKDGCTSAHRVWLLQRRMLGPSYSSPERSRPWFEIVYRRRIAERYTIYAAAKDTFLAKAHDSLHLH